MIKFILNLFLIVFLIEKLNCENLKYDEKRCIELGFRKTELFCNSCNELNKFDLGELKDDCEACCTIASEEKAGVKKTYNYARLEICNCKLGYYPQIHAFMKEKAKQFKNLDVKHVPGAEPVIKLIEDGVVKEKLSIQKWDTDTIEEFFKEHLIKN